MSQSFMSDITRLNVQSNRNRNFIIRKIDCIKSEKAITNKAFFNENTRLGDYKLIEFLDNPIASSKKRDFFEVWVHAGHLEESKLFWRSS